MLGDLQPDDESHPALFFLGRDAERKVIFVSKDVKGPFGFRDWVFEVSGLMVKRESRKTLYNVGNSFKFGSRFSTL